MNLVPYILFITIFIIDYLAMGLRVIPFSFTYLAELISGILFIFIVLRASYTKSFFLPNKYALLAVIYLAHILCGLILNNVSAGPTFLGARLYFKYIPFFLLPAVYAFSEKQIATQIKILLLFALAQIPVALFQKFIQFRGIYTGDVVRGTLDTSSAVSIFLVSAIVIILGFYLKNRISAKHFIILALLLFLPTTINETKGVVILFPFAIFTVILFSAKDRHAKKRIVNVMAVTVLFGFIFSVVYSAFFITDERAKTGVFEFFSDPDKVMSYLYREEEFSLDLLKPKKGGQVIATSHEKSHEYYSRLNVMIAPISLLSNDPTKLLFGLGIGNVSPTKRSVIQGDYVHLSKVLGAAETVVSIIIWETGVIGLILLLVFCYMLFSDARRLSSYDTYNGALALGWLGVVMIFVLSFPYKNVLVFKAIGVLFWYLSGYIASTNYRLMREQNMLQLDNNFTRFSRKSKQRPNEQ